MGNPGFICTFYVTVTTHKMKKDPLNAWEYTPFLSCPQ